MAQLADELTKKLTSTSTNQSVKSPQHALDLVTIRGSCLDAYDVKCATDENPVNFLKPQTRQWGRGDLINKNPGD